MVTVEEFIPRAKISQANENALKSEKKIVTDATTGDEANNAIFVTLLGKQIIEGVEWKGRRSYCPSALEFFEATVLITYSENSAWICLGISLAS
jgi:hypothetical protein